MVAAVTKTILTRQAVGLAAAVVAGVGLWRFTSGDWLGGIVFTAVVGSLAAWYWLRTRRPRDTRRY
jgi:membrane protein implicated in regulation of membrane protease activity